MERLSSFERVVGNIPETEKEQILHDKGERFDDQVFEDLVGKEREKTPEESQIISLANNATNEVRQRYGLENFDIPPENIHVITEERWPKERGVAFYNSMLQAIVAREQPARIVFTKKIFHEMLHFKSYNALQIKTGENPELDEYRVGLTVHTRYGKRMYFVNLNEAVTEEMTKRFATKLFDNPLFARETKQTKDVITRYPRAITGSGEPLFDDDTFYAEVEGKKSWGEAVGRLFGAQEKPKKITTECFTYQSERKILNTLIDKILERNSEKFQDREEIFEIFAKGMMTGNILPVGRLIERTFGNGTLRRIGELDQDIQAQKEFVNSL
jgi:hypothetical protein